MATMKRFALVCLALLAASVGLSEQEGGFLRCFWPRNDDLGVELSPEAKDVEAICNYIRKKQEITYYSNLETLAVITAFASKNSGNKLANSIKNLDPKTCDPSAIGRVKDALQTIERNRCHVEAEALLELKHPLLWYIEASVNSCNREEESRELTELDTLLNGLGPNPKLASQLELIASKGSENTLAALFKGITAGNYDLAGLRAANEVIKVIDKRYDAQDAAKRLRSILDRYKRQVLKTCLQGPLKDWPDGDCKFLEKLDEHKRAAVSSLFEIVAESKKPLVRADLRLLKIAERLPQGDIDTKLLVAIKDNITLRTDDDLQRHPSWTFHVTDVLDRWDLDVHDPCKAFIGLESAGAMRVFFEAAVLVDPEMLMDEIGITDSKSSKLAQWAGRWGVCNWILGLNKDQIAAKIVQIDKERFKGRKS